MAGPVRKCALCLQVAELQDSHLLPKAVYKLCRGAETVNPNPILIDRIRRTYAQTSSQEKQYLLCYDCEQLLQGHGEDYTLRQIYRGRRFRLFDEVSKGRIIRSVPSMSAVSLGEGFRATDLVHFIVGVIWKAAVWATPQIELGRYSEPLREFLRGKASIPDRVSIQVYVPAETAKFKTLLAFPSSIRSGSEHHHLFVIPGLKCVVTVNYARTNWLTVTDVRNGVVIIDEAWDEWSQGGSFGVRT